ncbi:MAG: beta-lactamase family protein, partial [Gemmatimonadota bacterium]|nr:beta-lactamase family protein [Gemmatimonadota bacterium]
MSRLLLAASLALPAALSAQTLPPVATVARVADSLAQAFLAEHGAPSVAIGVIRGADTIVMKAWGKTDLEQGVVATAKSVYRIGSVTKQFTAAAAMQLVEQGKLRLDDSIGTHISSLPAAWRPVTVRQLLNHTSGIPSYTAIGPAWARRWGEEMTPDTLLALTAAAPMRFPSGTKWEYDNTGYVLLGMLIEKGTGRPWGTDLEERFTKPLGLSDTRNCTATPLVPRRVRGYDPQGNGWVNAPYLAMSQPYAAGAICSTVGDIARWNRALHTGKVVSPASYALMTNPAGVAVEAKYGFGLGRDTVGGRPMISHGGGIHGFRTENVWVPSEELSVTVLANSGSAPADRLRRQLTLAALGLALDQPPKVVPLSAADRARYVGVYALALPGGTRDFTVAEQGEQLTGQLAGQGPNPMLHFGEHTFGVSFDPTVRVIFAVEGGRAMK